MKKKLFGKVASCVAASCLAISMMFTTSYAAEATNPVDAANHDGDYSIETILSRYQYFVKGNLTVDNHTVGAFVSGGDVKIGAYGDGAIVDSYAKNVKAVGNYNNGAYFDKIEKYSGYLGKKLYYKTTDTGVTATGEMVQNDSYINVDTAFETIKEESKSLATAADKTMEKADLKTFDFDNKQCKVLLLDFSESVDNISIPQDVFDACDLIVLKGEDTLDDFVASQKVINILGSNSKKNAAIGCNYNYTDSGDGKKAIFFSSDKSGKTIHEVDNANNVLKLDLMNNEHGLKKLNETPLSKAHDAQIRESGVKLIWNLPEETVLETEYLPGHVVAPNADITISGGNFEGGYIAAKITSDAEGHFYPYNALAEYVASKPPTSGETGETGEGGTTSDKEPKPDNTGETGGTGATESGTTSDKEPKPDNTGETGGAGATEGGTTSDKEPKPDNTGETGGAGITEGANTEDSENDNIKTENTASNDSDEATATQDKETDGANDGNKTTTTQDTATGGANDSNETTTTQDTATGGANDSNETTTTNTVVSTGDDFDVAVPTALMLMVGAGVILCIKKKNKIK